MFFSLSPSSGFKSVVAFVISINNYVQLCYITLQVVKDSRLLICVVVLVLIDVVILMLWEIINPIGVREQTGVKEVLLV